MKKINLTSASKNYLVGLVSIVLALFIISGAVFLLLIANRLDIVMNSKPSDTYTYFIMIMDRLLILLTLFALVPLSIQHWISKDKKTIDNIIFGISAIILLGFIFAFISGELRFYDKYKSGELANSKLFGTTTIEMKIFDKY